MNVLRVVICCPTVWNLQAVIDVIAKIRLTVHEEERTSQMGRSVLYLRL
jgi:hypothetical protein